MVSHQYIQMRKHVLVAISIWTATVLLAGKLGVFTHLPLPSISFLVVFAITAQLLLYYRHRDFQAFVVAINPMHLTVFHLWRIAAGFTFLYYGSQQLLPERFVLNAGYGDLAVGFLVPIILLLGGSTEKYIAFHLFSLLDFIVAVGTGLTFTLLSVPTMSTIATFPIVLIPLVGVPITGASSVMAIDVLLKQRQKMLAAS